LLKGETHACAQEAFRHEEWTSNLDSAVNAVQAYIEEQR